MNRLYVTYHPGSRVFSTMREYRDPFHNIVIPANFATDLATVPRIFWALISPFDLGIRAPVIHDYLYQEKRLSRYKCDQIFWLDMYEESVPAWKRETAYWATRVFGWMWYHGFIRVKGR